MNKKISIITINYNNLSGLQRTVASVINQTYKDFEYIVIDGGSTDGSAAYIESQSQHINYWVSEPDKGIYNAMNKGILKATGEYLLFLNSGDHFYGLEVLEKNHHHVNDYDLVYFDLVVCESDCSYIKKYPTHLKFSYLYVDTLPHPATFISKSLFKLNGLYDETLDICSDWKFFIECICLLNSTYRHVNQKLSVFYTDGYSSQEKNRELILQEKKYVLKHKFSSFIDDIEQFMEQQILLDDLRKSRKISLLVKYGLLNKF